MKFKPWLEAMRLRTLPVSTAGVLAATALAVHDGAWQTTSHATAQTTTHHLATHAADAINTAADAINATADAINTAADAINATAHRPAAWGGAVLCLVFAILAQVASNFANEYYDYRAGLDRAGRCGPRRGVTEGDITPRAMLRATYATLAAAGCVGLSLIAWGGWWLLPAGVVIALGALAYSAGPWPLSRHALGEVAVIAFFGIIPVTLTYYVQTGHVTTPVFVASVGMGLLGANVLIVNNYRDRHDDRAVGKTTLATLLPGWTIRTLYLLCGLAGIGLAMWCVGAGAPSGWMWLALQVLVVAQVMLWLRLCRKDGAALNPQLGMTAMLMLATAAAMWL